MYISYLPCFLYYKLLVYYLKVMEGSKGKGYGYFFNSFFANLFCSLFMIGNLNL